MSDKTKDQVRKDFEMWWSFAKYAPPSPSEIWQAAHEMYAPKWISVEDRMPDAGKEVLLSYKNGLGNRVTVVGIFALKFTLLAGDDDHECTEYNEEEDEYYCQEGWYESQRNWDDYRWISIHEGEVDLWMPLPQEQA